MKMLIQYPTWFGRVQKEVAVKELYEHEGQYIAIHHPYGRYDYYTASDLLTGLALSSSTSKKFALEKAKYLITRHKEKMRVKQNQSFKALFKSINGSVDFKLMERIERKCVARGKTSAKVIEIAVGPADTLYVEELIL